MHEKIMSSRKIIVNWFSIKEEGLDKMKVSILRGSKEDKIKALEEKLFQMKQINASHKP